MKVGVLLSGCGVEDGSEVYEAVLSIMAVERGSATVQAMAPDVEQATVINHYTGAEVRTGSAMSSDRRNVLPEAARIVRGKIMSATEISAHDIDALIIPGGYGVVRNLCTFAVDAEDATVNPEVERLIQGMNGLGKPIGALCIAPVLVALALRGKNLHLTVGSDAKTALSLTRLGATHHVTGVEDIHVDNANHIVSTAAFMLAQSVSEAEPGITKLVNRVLQMARELGPGHPGTAVSRTVAAR
jgi:enhancing lycopene biosynthesis protein 2